ncbi:MAG: DMT family transporter [Caldimonas sp.]
MHRLRNWQLFAICVLTWGTTWYAVTYQVTPIAPEFSVALRFGLAGVLVVAGCALRGLRLRFALRDHALFAFQGVFLYGLAYVGIYYAERHIASGLVAVGYSASPLITGLGAWALFGVPARRRFVLGGALGIAGVALIFWPEFGNAHYGAEIGLGAALTVASVVLSAIGSLAASRNRPRGLPFWPGLGYGMLYGALACLAAGLTRGASIALPASASWWLSLIYLVLAGSVLTFACFLTLQDRIGPGPTGAVGVMTPLLALLVSMALEGYRPDAYTAAGAVLAVFGNVLMLGRGARKRPVPTVAAASARQGRHFVARTAGD